MALQLRACFVFNSQWSTAPQLSSDTNYCKYGSKSNGGLVVGGMCRGRRRFIGHLRCSSSNVEKGVPYSNYVVPLSKTFSPSNSSCLTRPLVEILRDLNKRVPDNIITPPSSSSSSSSSTFLP
ncbi:DDT domain-containing protein, putative isoform 1 [Hibiscus syriacus]|uniref:DDT domain-containing protein, putative isoform 1 n=1 Tax=Hibiscus syriacus TaxID=106335 RepID=A0A6A3AQ56_HIBSY|nr:DDT domain-containing protein, putative isoform 1 [Hibiscus syriacus]